MHDHIVSRHDQFIKDLETIVNIDSGSHYAAGVEKIVAFFQDRFSQLDWRTKTYAFAEGKVPCLEAANVDPSAADTVFDFFFIGHMDTVFLEREAQKRPFSMDGNHAKGPGVCDMKGGLVAVLHVMETLQHFGIAKNCLSASALTVMRKSDPAPHGLGSRILPKKASAFLFSSPAAWGGSGSSSAKVAEDMILSAMAKRLMPGSNRKRAPMQWSSWPIKFWK
jgi:hypothetical protein